VPPRYAYWTILIDNKPTAFRAREKEEMLPTFHQLRRTNTDVVLKWFARGRLWESPEAAQAAGRETAAARESRGRGWRPGGAHRDPRDRFKKGGKGPHESSRPRAATGGSRDGPASRAAPPGRDSPRHAPPRGAQPRRDKPPGAPPRGAKSGAHASRGDDARRDPDAWSQDGVRPRNPSRAPREGPIERREADPQAPRRK
jgi:hypothetical protein